MRGSETLIFSISKRPSLYSRNQLIVDNDLQDLLLEQNMQADAVCSYNSDFDWKHIFLVLKLCINCGNFFIFKLLK